MSFVDIVVNFLCSTFSGCALSFTKIHVSLDELLFLVSTVLHKSAAVTQLRNTIIHIT